ncbi:helix-turn-helix domain-containing protein [Desulfonatronovibrio magnus]|uniref:helix-turn-helix domain-containing protein n=1 Tax=Desulfonatronovibrio magnus TaxID=698827 RepID=UPI0005EAEB0E|nr:helix-turn-helix transcriptional regulator [Desulfonatronovibrio magnus]
MQVLTKTHHTEDIELRIIGPKHKKDDVLREIKKHGYADSSDSIHWRELFPEFENEPDYSMVLRKVRSKEGLTQNELSKMTGIPQGHISKMENGKLAIGKDRAKRLAEVLKVDYRILL